MNTNALTSAVGEQLPVRGTHIALLALSDVEEAFNFYQLSLDKPFWVVYDGFMKLQSNIQISTGPRSVSCIFMDSGAKLFKDQDWACYALYNVFSCGAIYSG